MIEFDCPCGKTLRVKAAHAGRRGRCKSCGASLTVPDTADGAMDDGGGDDAGLARAIGLPGAPDADASARLAADAASASGLKRADEDDAVRATFPDGRSQVVRVLTDGGDAVRLVSRVCERAGVAGAGREAELQEVAAGLRDCRVVTHDGHVLAVADADDGLTPQALGTRIQGLAAAADMIEDHFTEGLDLE